MVPVVPIFATWSGHHELQLCSWPVEFFDVMMESSGDWELHGMW